MTTRVFQPVTRTIELAVQGTYAGEQVENKFYAQALSAVTEAMVTELVGIVADWVAAHMLSQLPSQYVHTRVVGRDISVDSSFEVIDVTHAGSPGTASGTGAPGNVTLAVHRDTRLSGKKAKSRIYWPGITEAAITSTNQIATVAGANIVDALDSLRSSILAGTESTYKYGYPQRIIDHVKLATGNFIEVFGHSLTDAILDSTRARLPGHGL